MKVQVKNLQATISNVTYNVLVSATVLVISTAVVYAVYNLLTGNYPLN